MVRVMSPCRVWPALVLLLFPSAVAAEEPSLLDGWHDVWLFRFLVNMLGYSTIIIPGYFLISYFKRTNYVETGLGLPTTFFLFFKCATSEQLNLVPHLSFSLMFRQWALLSSRKDLRVWERGQDQSAG